MSLEKTSHDPATPEQADTVATEDRTYGSLEDAMSALKALETDDAEGDDLDTTQSDQPEAEADPETDTEDESDDVQEEEAEEEVEAEAEEEGDDREEDIEPLTYDPSRTVTLEDGTEAPTDARLPFLVQPPPYLQAVSLRNTLYLLQGGRVLLAGHDDHM